MRIKNKLLLFTFAILLTSSISAASIYESFEPNAADWSYSEADAHSYFYGEIRTDWKTEGLNSYGLMRNNAASSYAAISYNQISRTCDLSNLTVLYFDANILLPNSEYKSEVLIDGDSVWLKTATTDEFLSQTIDVSTYDGDTTIVFKLWVTSGGGFGDGPAYFKIDNIIFPPTNPTNPTNLGNNTIDHTPAVTWTKGVNAVGSDVVNTYIYVGDTSTPTTMDSATTNETTNLGQNTTLTDGDTFYYRLRSFSDGLWSSYTTADEFRMNTIPTTPSVSSPLNNSIQTTSFITPVASSSDAENDSLTYYFYGDTTAGTTLLGTSTNGTYTWYQFLCGDYVFRVRAHDGYEYSDYSNPIYFTWVVPTFYTENLIENGDFELWSGGPSVAPDNWTISSGTVAREDSTVKKNTYSVKLTGDDKHSRIEMSFSDYEDYAGESLSFGSWCYTPLGTTGKIHIDDGNGYHETAFNGNDAWQFITATGVISGSVSELVMRLYPDTSGKNKFSYFDDAILVKGSYLYETTPTNNSSHTFSFPPLLHDIEFVWQDTNADGYNYQVSTDVDFHLIIKEDTVSSNTVTLPLEADDYYWRVYAYDTGTTTYSEASDVWQFTINETNGASGITSVDGVVYEVTTAAQVAVDGALVNIWNTTWSDSMLVGQNGYYYFDGAQSGTYSVRATKTGYTDSSIELITVTSNETTTRNILLQSSSGAGQEYVDHYVKFIVKSLFGIFYEGVEVNVYLGDAVIPKFTDYTGTDGSIGFELDEDQRYRITFIDASQLIDIEVTIFPVDESYTVYVGLGTMLDDLQNPDDEDQAITAVNTTISKTIINDNTANITVSYTDMMDETNDLTFTLLQSIAGDQYNKTELSTVSLETNNNPIHNFTVTNYNGQSYFIKITTTHDTHGAIERLYGVQFENTETRFGFTEEAVGWLAIIFLVWFALTATNVTVPQTAIGVCALSSVMMMIGWGYYISIPGLALAWIIAIAANMAKGKETVA